jgi:hypothetical protein
VRFITQFAKAEDARDVIARKAEFVKISYLRVRPDLVLPQPDIVRSRHTARRCGAEKEQSRECNGTQQQAVEKSNR